MRRLAQERFVCAADEVWRLQRGSDQDCVFFQRAVNGGKRITDPGTRQGTWLFAPDGTRLGFVNSRKPEAVCVVLEEALARFAELPASARRLPAGVELTPAHRWEDSFPEDGLVLTRIARDLDADGPEGQRAPAWNRDCVWVSRAEVTAMLGTPAPGERVELALLARRLARFSLVDNVRGQTLPYAGEEIRRARLTATVTARVGSALVLRLEGESEALAEGPWLLGNNLWKPAREHAHGLEARLHGRAVFERERGCFTEFELVAVASRFGFTENNGRWREPAPGRIAFHLALAAAGARVAPAFVAVYDADWIVAPTLGTWNASPAECGLEQE